MGGDWQVSQQTHSNAQHAKPKEPKLHVPMSNKMRLVVAKSEARCVCGASLAGMRIVQDEVQGKIL